MFDADQNQKDSLVRQNEFLEVPFNDERISMRHLADITAHKNNQGLYRNTGPEIILITG